jgi:hypothetical protein
MNTVIAALEFAGAKVTVLWDQMKLMPVLPHAGEKLLPL